MLYLQYLGQQIDPELIKEMAARSNAVEKAYSVYRARVGGKELTENEVRDVLRTSKDSARRRAVWEASKAVGPILAAGPEEAGPAAEPGGPATGLQGFPRRCSLPWPSRARSRC